MPFLDLILGPVFKVIDKVIPDPQERERQKLAVLKMQQEGEFKGDELRYSAIVAEANSTDPYTSRARPSFMYVFYAMIVFLIIVMPLIGLLNPLAMTSVLANVKLGFAAIPEAMWWTFSAGYLGYTGARTMEKVKGIA